MYNEYEILGIMLALGRRQTTAKIWVNHGSGNG